MLALVRHGETAANRDGLVLGRADPALTEEGLRQAGSLAAALNGGGVSAVITSPLLRARQTGAAIAAAAGLTPAVDDRLIEVDWGSWEGRPAGGLSVAELDRFKANAGSAPDGESLRSVGERVAEFATEALSAEGLVVAVTHVSPIKAAVAWVLGADDTAALRMFVGLASITRLARRPAGPVLVSFNETGHLV